MTVTMVDGISTDVPAILARFGRAYPVGGYIWQPGVLAEIPWSSAQLREFPAGHQLTATLPVGLELAAREARELDVETGDARPDNVPLFLNARFEAGHDDGQVYCDMSNLPAVLAHIDAEGISVWRLRVAWWWGRPGAPRLDQVMAQIRAVLDQAALANLMPDAGRVWGCQWFAGGSYDLTAVYGAPDFTRPTT